MCMTFWKVKIIETQNNAVVTSDTIREELTRKGQHERIILVDGVTNHPNWGGSFMARSIYENLEIYTKKVRFYCVYFFFFKYEVSSLSSIK